MSHKTNTDYLEMMQEAFVQKVVEEDFEGATAIVKELRHYGFSTEAQKLDDLIPCLRCNGKRVVEEMGDGANFEWDVIGNKKCPLCSE